MKTLTLLTTVAATLGLVAPLAAAPLNPEHISVRAHWYMHADADALRSSQTGGLLMETMEQRHGAQFRAFARLFSFNPLEDLNAITIYGRDDQGVVLVHASMDPNHLTDLVAAGEGHESTDHEGVTVHSWLDQGKRQAGAIVNDNLLLLSEQVEWVTHALDVIAGRAESLGEDLIRTVEAQSTIVVGVVDLSQMEELIPQAAFLREAKSMRMTLAERTGRLEASAELVLSDAAKAQPIANLIEGMIAFAQLTQPEVTELGFEVGVSADRETGRIGVTISVPVEDAVKQIESELAKQADGS